MVDMKKSEMTKLILKYLVGKAVYEIYPHEILELIEKAGMRPPVTIMELKGGYGMNAYTHVVKKGDYWVGACSGYAWEPEDGK
jgi:hypothetical protein